MWGRTIRSFEALRLQGEGGGRSRGRGLDGGRGGGEQAGRASAPVLTLLEIHVGHGFINPPGRCSHYINTAHLAGKGTRLVSLLPPRQFALVPSQ